MEDTLNATAISVLAKGLPERDLPPEAFDRLKKVFSSMGMDNIPPGFEKNTGRMADLAFAFQNHDHPGYRKIGDQIFSLVDDIVRGKYGN